MTNPANAASREARALTLLCDQYAVIYSPQRVADIRSGREQVEPAIIRAMLALADEAASQPREGVRYRHLKRGTVYEMVGTAELQAEQPQAEHAALAIYRGDDGKLWARNTAEFHDGRFEAFDDTAPTDQATGADIAQVPTDQAQRGGEVERLREAALSVINLTIDGFVHHCDFDADRREQMRRVARVNLDAALAQSGKGVISTPDMPKGGEQ